MCRNILCIALCASFFPWLTSQATAQIVVPGLPLVKPITKPNELIDQLQKQMDPARKQAVPKGKAGQPSDQGAIIWGGVRLNPVDRALQEELGLAENEGLVVAQVQADSSADKAGLQAKDVLVKINNKVVPGDVDRFIKFVKDQKTDEAMEVIVVRDGKEQTIKGARMPALAQSGFQGGKGRKAGMLGFGPGLRLLIVPRIAKGERKADLTVDGARILRKQNQNEFSGEYVKDNLKITVAGKIDNGVAKTDTITVQDGKETKTYTDPAQVPEQYRPLLQRIMPAGVAGEQGPRPR